MFLSRFDLSSTSFSVIDQFWAKIFARTIKMDKDYIICFFFYLLLFALCTIFKTPTDSKLRLADSTHQLTGVEINTVCSLFFFSFSGRSSEPEINKSLRENLCHLPGDNLVVLSYLIHFLSRVAAHSQLNHMPVENLATIFGPCIFQ